MSLANPAVARRVVHDWGDLAAAAYLRQKVPADLVLAVICQESAGSPTAFRVERKFFARYGAAMLRMAKLSPSRHDDKWMYYPDLAASSIGLMQPLYQTALELGFDLEYPTDLCDPALNIQVGCAKLIACKNRLGGAFNVIPVGALGELPLRDVLQAYNGGGNPAYAAEVIAWRAMVRAELHHNLTNQPLQGA